MLGNGEAASISGVSAASIVIKRSVRNCSAAVGAISRHMPAQRWQSHSNALAFRVAMGVLLDLKRAACFLAILDYEHNPFVIFLKKLDHVQRHRLSIGGEGVKLQRQRPDQ